MYTYSKYHNLEKLFRSYWVTLLQRELANNNMAAYELCGKDENDYRDAMLYLPEFDIEITLIPNTKNKAMKLVLGYDLIELLVKKYCEDNQLQGLDSDSKVPFVTQTVFTLRDLRKDSRFCAIVRTYLGYERIKQEREEKEQAALNVVVYSEEETD
jgi:hypothetical protein